MPRLQQPPIFVPKVGDLVYFYFLHAFSEKRVCHIDGDVTELYSGRSEMRCRPARVVEVVYEYEEGANLQLEVEFQDDDRCLVGSDGVVHRLSRKQHATPCCNHFDGHGRVGIGWPRDRQWGDKPKTV
jgi:hypothetical protein